VGKVYFASFESRRYSLAEPWIVDDADRDLAVALLDHLRADGLAEIHSDGSSYGWSVGFEIDQRRVGFLLGAGEAPEWWLMCGSDEGFFSHWRRGFPIEACRKLAHAIDRHLHGDPDVFNLKWYLDYPDTFFEHPMEMLRKGPLRG
jgi:hypothetical protein